MINTKRGSKSCTHTPIFSNMKIFSDLHRSHGMFDRRLGGVAPFAPPPRGDATAPVAPPPLDKWTADSSVRHWRIQKIGFGSFGRHTSKSLTKLKNSSDFASSCIFKSFTRLYKPSFKTNFGRYLSSRSTPPPSRINFVDNGGI